MPPPEPPLYRPFALLALGATMAGGTPLGIWMLTRLYWGGGQIAPEWTLLHAHLQIFGFFGVLILGVAQHLVPRFTNRRVTRGRLAPWLVGLVVAALILRIGGALTGSRGWVPIAALLQVAAFLAFGVWVWRSLPPPHLAVTRRHLTVATGWLVVALAAEALLRASTSAADGMPDPRGMGAVHLVAVLGGIAGWIVGVILRAGPMFVPGWSVSTRLGRAAPWALGLGAMVAVAGEVGEWDGGRGAALVKLGEALALGTVAAIGLTGGALTAARGALPLLSRSGPETRFFRLAMVSAAIAAVGSAVVGVAAWRGVPPSLLADALRHFVTVGFLTAMVLAMLFRLIPVLSGAALRWPRLRTVAFWAILAGVVLRSAEILADYGAEAILPWVPVSGLLVWLALLCVAANLVATLRSR